MNRQNLKNLSNSIVADAPPNNITAVGVRGFNDTLIPSVAAVLEDNIFTDINTFNEKVVCVQDIYTGYQLALTPQATIDLTSVIGNYIEISGTSDVIENFGGCGGGEIRFIKFNDPCQLSSVGNIRTPNNQLINVESGDTCTVIGTSGDVWIITNYQRATGLPLAASIIESWTVTDAYPTLNESNPPYLLGYRWVSKESGGRRKEWISDNDQYATAIWNPMGGSFGIWGDGKDLEIDNISVNSFNGLPFISLYDIRYTRVSNKFTINGFIEISEVSGSDGFISFDFLNNNQGLNFDDSTMLGFGSFTKNGQPVLNRDFSVYSLDSQRLYVETGGTWNLDTIKIQFRITIFLQD